MMNRRTFLSLSFGSLAAPSLGLALGNGRKVALYANVGSVLWQYDVNPAQGTLKRRSSFSLPAGVQFAWPHASRRCLYVVSSDWQKSHYLTALKIDPLTGELSQLGSSVALPDRPIHVTTDLPSAYVLVAFNAPSGVRIFRVQPDLTIGAEVPQPGLVDRGIFAHEVRVTPDNRHVVLVTRGIPATGTKPEEPGALKMFDYTDGRLSNEASIAPNGGRGFGPRDVDFHPERPWAYVSLETQSKLFMYRTENGRLVEQPDFITDTIADSAHKMPRQLAGDIHVHPNGRVVYVANRADSTVDFDGTKVFAGGENSIAVFALDPIKGKPTSIQHIDTQKVYPRTFQIDPTNRILIAQHTLPVSKRDGDNVRVVPAGFTVFRIGTDGKLTLERVYDVETGNETMFWMGMVQL